MPMRSEDWGGEVGVSEGRVAGKKADAPPPPPPTNCAAIDASYSSWFLR
jgi:hypothetical protein